jgi:hypothetical protein
MEKGLLIRELAEQLGVAEDTVTNWEVRGRRPTKRHMGRVTDVVPNVAGFWNSGNFGSYKPTKIIYGEI